MLEESIARSIEHIRVCSIYMHYQPRALCLQLTVVLFVSAAFDGVYALPLRKIGPSEQGCCFLQRASVRGSCCIRPVAPSASTARAICFSTRKRSRRPAAKAMHVITCAWQISSSGSYICSVGA